MEKFIFDLQRFDSEVSTWDAFKTRFESDSGTSPVTITLSGDIKAERDNGTPVTASSKVNVTVDLNGHTLDLDGGCLYVDGTSHLTIKDSTTTTITPKTGNGKIVSSVLGQSGLIQVTSGALTVESGTIDYVGKKNSPTGAIYGDNGNGTITINGGVIINRNGYGILSQNDVGVNINDGTIIGLGKNDDNVAYTALLGGNSTTDKFIVKGGSFSSKPDADNNGVKLDTGKQSSQDANNTGYWEITSSPSSFETPDLSSFASGFQVGGNTYDTLADALTNVVAGGTIKLLGDYTLPSNSEDIEITKNVTIDLNGKTLNLGSQSLAVKTSGVTLTISDSTKTATPAGNGKIITSSGDDRNSLIYLNDGGSLIVNGGTLDFNYTGPGNNPGTIYCEDNSSGTVTINDGIIKNSKGYGIYAGSGGTVTINNGTVIGGGGAPALIGNGNDPENPNITINKGTFSSNPQDVENSPGIRLAAGKTAKANTTNSSYYDVGDDTNGYGSGYGVPSGSGSTTNVCKIGDTEYATLAAAITAATAGQTITLLGDANLSSDLTINKSVTIDLNGHTLDAGTHAINVAFKQGTSGNVLPTLKVTDSSTNQDGSITGTGEKLISVSAANLTLDAGTIGNTGTNGPAIYIDVSVRATTVTISGGTVKSSSGVAIHQTGNNATTTISGGNFVGGGTDRTALQKDSGTMTITGGTFSSNVQSLLGTGYTSTQTAGTDTTDDFWTVSSGSSGGGSTTNVCKIGDTEYATLAAAVDAATEGQTITLLKDVTAKDSGATQSTSGYDLTINKNITLDLNGYKLDADQTVIYASGATLTVKDSSSDNSGSVVGGSSSGLDSGVFYAQSNGKIVIESGTFDKGNREKLFGAHSQGDNKVEIKGGKFKDNIQALAEQNSYIEIAEGFKTEYNSTSGYYEVVEDEVGEFEFSNGKVTYKVGGEVAFTIDGLSDSATTSDLSLSDNVVTISANALDSGKTVSISGGEYKLALADDVTKPTASTPTWSIAGGTAKYNQATSAGYNLSSDSTKINYAAASSKDLFTIDGLSDSATTSDLSLSDKVITISANALGDKNITLTGDGYKLALAEDATGSTESSTDWAFSNGTAKYSTTTTTTQYKLSGNQKSINYSEKSSEKIFVTVEGVNSANGLEFNSTTKTLQIPQSAAQNSTVKVNSKTFAPESDLEIYAEDKNSAVLVSGKISVESSFTDAEPKTLRVTGGKVTAELVDKKITSITGLDDGEKVTFDGTTYKKVDGALIIGDKIYQDVPSDTDILDSSNFTDAGLYLKVGNNFDLEAAKEKIKNDDGVTKIYLGSADDYDETYFAVLTLDGEKMVLQKNPNGTEISNPTLKLDNAAELELDFAATIAAKDDGVYKIGDEEIQISDPNGYNILTDENGKVKGLEKISGGSEIEKAKDVPLLTDSPGEFEFPNDKIAIKGDSEVELVTDDDSNLSSVNELQNGDLFTKLKDISLNDNNFSIQGDDDGVTLRSDAEGNLSSIGGVNNKATILGVGDASIKLQNDSELTIDGKNYALANDKDGVIISGGKIFGLDTDGQLVLGNSGIYNINGEEISVNGGDTITTDRAGNPYIYNPQDEEIFESLASDENNVIASPTETTDLTGKEGAVIVATNGAKVENYDANSFMTFLLGDIANVLAAIRNQSLTFSDNIINFFGNSITFNSAAENDSGSFAANISNKNLTETRQVGWSANSGGSVDESESRQSKVLVGNYSTGKNSAVLQSGRGNDYIFAGSGDTVKSDWGNNSIELNHNTNSNEGTNIAVSENYGSDSISGFTDGYEDNSDKITVSDSENLDIKFRNGKLRVKNGNRKMLFDNVNKTSTASSADGVGFIHSDTDSGDVVRLLVDAENVSADLEDETESLKYAVADENATIRVEHWYEEADYYIGSGKTSALDFEQYYSSDIEVNLQSEQFQNFGIVAGGFNNHTIIGSEGRETLIAGTGKGNIWGAGGNDLLSGYDQDGKEYGSVFYFMAGDGKDTIENFEEFDEYWTHTADTLSSGGQEITGVRLVGGDDVEFKVGDGYDFVRITDSKNKLLMVDDGEIHGYRVGDSLAYDDYTTDFVGNGKATITISDNASGDLNIWLDGSDGRNYSNIKVLDGSNSYKKSTLVGGANSEKIFASQNNSTLWGGVDGNDTLFGSDGDDEFFYSFGNGKDVINNATENDVVNIFNTSLSQITNVSATTSQIKFQFDDLGSLTINSTENVGIKYQNVVYQFDRQNKTWSKK